MLYSCTRIATVAVKVLSILGFSCRQVVTKGQRHSEMEVSDY